MLVVAATTLVTVLVGTTPVGAKTLVANGCNYHIGTKNSVASGCDYPGYCIGWNYPGC